jgi:hypothetical protein
MTHNEQDAAKVAAYWGICEGCGCTRDTCAEWADNPITVKCCPDCNHVALDAMGPICTCPSGDGSLRWPCPEHPHAAAPVRTPAPEREVVTAEQVGIIAGYLSTTIAPFLQADNVRGALLDALRAANVPVAGDES